ncbi:selenoneine biosynthesis selenosugar synthase SenB [Massilia sp. Mn16-1_5]|uniref:selenoneine biosynthesis selenosugar synthase SenB n=1 Tax=Massilia sp. Mn16-1_5 TaxID=2079199 RepID=UPI00109E7513|nr:selenoneine biosynthesis selenosugar synthase SenB [Massilia sp. Mn16-1_5]THC40326.1 TIGR04348 family glycosyltransferase [Massilia sp. Mn16-1_5]
MDRLRILIASPAAAADNNGNWQTASRWARFLRGPYAVTVAGGWSVDDPAPDLLIALHARRSAQALAGFKAAHPERPALLVLTGTDLYRDIDSVPEARASLELADALVVLQDAGLARLPARVRPKARVIYQSAPPLRPSPPAPARRHLDICMIGHLRPEKDPQTFMRAAALVRTPGVRLLHIGGALDPTLEQAARDTAAATPRYRWLGPLPHARTRQRLKRCHAMVIASRMEGGANVIIEAVSSGVPVLASHIDGNVGMLGQDYAGYFEAGDAPALAALIERCVADPDFDALLRRQCAARAGLFLPETERAALSDLVDNLLPAPRVA